MIDHDLTTGELKALGSPTELMDREWAPCRYNCPVHADVQRYIDLAGQGRFLEAIDVVREHLPFAVVCGRICHHPCEQNCRRNDVDKPVAIKEVKRFVAEYIGTGATVHKAAVQDKAKIAVVGAGPAGMSAALDLAKLGYRPTVFEKFPIGGGVPATAVPKYRLPKDAVQIDVDWILAHGVEMKTNVEIGKDKTIEQLRKEGYKAILLAAGLAGSRMLPLPGADNKRVFPVMKFLTSAGFGEKIDIGKNVLVIGGGNVACDAARTAVRLGASKVRMMCLEDEQEMPAWEWEIREAKEEGVSVIYRRGPVEIVAQGGDIKGLKARKVTRVFDEQKRFNPQYEDSDVILVDCDTVIFAIGQMADLNFIKGSELKTDQRGRLEFNPATHQTNVADIFACGEIVTPPGSVVEACANGHRAAGAIDMYLSGKKIEIDDSLPVSIDKIAACTAEKVTKTERVKVPTKEPEKRRVNFKEFEHTLDPEAASCEGRRCMNCGSGAEVLIDKCIACLTCLRVCPFDIPKVTDVARIESKLCQSCGMCIAECPVKAIVLRGKELEELKSVTAKALAEKPAVNMAAFICGHRASVKGWQGKDGQVAGVTQFYLKSMAGLSVSDILNAFESGADNVVVIACEESDERYPDSTWRLRKRVDQAKALLTEAGFEPDSLKMMVVKGDTDSIRQALETAKKEIEYEC